MRFQFVVIFIDSFMDDVSYVRDGNRTEEKLSFVVVGSRAVPEDHLELTQSRLLMIQEKQTGN
jgi:hypothetical protein